MDTSAMETNMIMADAATDGKKDAPQQNRRGRLMTTITKITFYGCGIFFGVIFVLHLANIGALTTVVAVIYALLIGGGLLYYLTGKKKDVVKMATWLWGRRNIAIAIFSIAVAVAGSIVGVNFVRNTFTSDIQVLIFMLLGMLVLFAIAGYLVCKMEIHNRIQKAVQVDSDSYEDDYSDEEYVDCSSELEDEPPATPVTVIEAIARVDERIGNKIFCAYGPGVQWAWISYTDGFKERGGMGRICLKGAPIEYADVNLAHNGYMEIHTCNITRIDSTTPEMPTARPIHPTNAYDNDIVESADAIATPDSVGGAAEDVSKETLPVINFDSQEGAEKWFRIFFHGELTGFINNINDSSAQSLTINPDGNAYVAGNDDPVFSFGQLPNVSTWDTIIEMLEANNFFAENREGRLFVSWTIGDDEDIW